NRMKKSIDGNGGWLPNSAIAELLAVAAETAKMPLQKALRRASRKAFLWEEEAALLVLQGRPLTELPGVGPSLDRIIRRWIENPPDVSTPQIRKGFLTLPEARTTIGKRDALRVKGDLQMHTAWSDGSGVNRRYGESRIRPGLRVHCDHRSLKRSKDCRRNQ